MYANCLILRFKHMLLGIPGGDEETRTAMEYLRAAENVVVEEA